MKRNHFFFAAAIIVLIVFVSWKIIDRPDDIEDSPQSIVKANTGSIRDYFPAKK